MATKETEEELPPTAKKRRVYSYIYCPHCQQNVSKSAYYRHKALSLRDDQGTESSSDSDNDVSNIDTVELDTSSLSLSPSQQDSQQTAAGGRFACRNNYFSALHEAEEG